MYFVDDLNRSKIAPLFEGWKETMIWSFLDGYMGEAWTDHPNLPQSAKIVIADFCFLAGKPCMELVQHIPPAYISKPLLMVPQHDAWAQLIEKAYGAFAKKITRYAIKKEPDVFCPSALNTNIQNLPEGYTIKLIDKESYHDLKKEAWSRDLCSQYPDYASFKKYGIGVVALFDTVLVSGASSYTSYSKGFEIEIDTRKDHRRKGLALACASKLILECLQNNLYPSWDAYDLRSVALAEKLGYHLDSPYVTYEVTPPKTKVLSV